jgi:hypothetical protein
MSDLKYRSDAELVTVIQEQYGYRCKLERQKADLEEQLGKVRRSINNSNIKSDWAMRYLSGQGADE